jgi:hypothetical protein
VIRYTRCVRHQYTRLDDCWLCCRRCGDLAYRPVDGRLLTEADTYAVPNEEAYKVMNVRADD